MSDLTIKFSYGTLFKFTFFVVALILVIMIVRGSSSPGIAANVINNGIASGSTATASGNPQVMKLSVQGSQYVLTPNTIKKGIPVRIEGDIANMPGCSKNVAISAFNVRKTVSDSDNVIEFTPDKAGTFNIACSMNMYKGSFTVLESDGTKAAYVEPVSAKGASCGGSGGGCGCGG